jgi:hypothetical protein
MKPKMKYTLLPGIDVKVIRPYGGAVFLAEIKG